MRSRKLPVSVCLALALFAVGCGEDGEGARTERAAAPSAETVAAQREILLVMERFHNRFYAGDPAAVCRMYTAKAAKETAAYGRKKDATCTEVMTAFAQPVTAELARELKARVLWVKVVGNRAVVRTSRNHAGRNIQAELTLVKRGGGWKFAEALGAGFVETTPLDGSSL